MEHSVKNILLENKPQQNHSKSNFVKLIKDVLTLGLTGFATFFSLILITKLFTYLVSLDAELKFDLDDIGYSLFGFFLLSLYKIFDHDTT